MVAVDTSVLVRLLVGDDPAQSASSRTLFATSSIHIADTVWLETEWVLRAAYGLHPADVCEAFRRLCGLGNVTVSDANRLAQIITWHEAGLAFADAFHVATSRGAAAFVTFDAALVKRAKKITDLPVEGLET